jgi:hypothetical protein
MGSLRLFNARVLAGLLTLAILWFLTPQRSLPFPPASSSLPGCTNCDCKSVSFACNAGNDKYNGLVAAYHWQTDGGASSNMAYSYIQILLPATCNVGYESIQTGVSVERWNCPEGDICTPGNNAGSYPTYECTNNNSLGADSGKNEPYCVCVQL